jgi:hypothetical protein
MLKGLLNGILNPLPRSKADVQAQIERFLEKGESFHSADAETIRYVIQYCEESNLLYRIDCTPGFGYRVSRQDE